MFLRRKWRDFRFWEPFWGIFGDLGVQTRRFFSFFVVTSPLRWGVGVLGATTHLLNVHALPHLDRPRQGVGE